MSKKILIIDDDPNIVSYLTSLFDDNGYVTCHAGNAQMGLEVAQREKPDLITLVRTMILPAIQSGTSMPSNPEALQALQGILSEVSRTK